MPNWCKNKMTVLGPKQQVESFMTAVAMPRTPLSFAGFTPACPDPLPVGAVRTLEYIADRAGWERSSLTRSDWGFDRDAAHVKEPSFSLLDNAGAARACAIYEFDTAWSPPIPVLECMSNTFPDLVFFLTYHEIGLGFEGHALLLSGRAIAQEEFPFCMYAGGDCPSARPGEDTHQ